MKDSHLCTKLVAVVGDILEENQTLLEFVGKHEFIEVTGPNHQPIYARGDLTGSDCSIHPGGNDWCVKLNQLAPCPIRDAKTIEVWIGDPSHQMLLRQDDTSGSDDKCARRWDEKLAFVVGVLQPGYLRVGMQIGWNTSQARHSQGDSRATRVGGMFTMFNVQRKSVGFMLPEERIAGNKTIQFSQIIVPLDRSLAHDTEGDVRQMNQVMKSSALAA